MHAQIQCLLGPGWDAFAQGLSFCGGRGSNSLPYMFQPRRLHGIADVVEHVALDEIAGAVRHRLHSVGSVRQLVQAGDVDTLIQRVQAFARSKPKAINTPSALEFTDLFRARAAAIDT